MGRVKIFASISITSLPNEKNRKALKKNKMLKLRTNEQLVLIMNTQCGQVWFFFFDRYDIRVCLLKVVTWKVIYIYPMITF